MAVKWNNFSSQELSTTSKSGLFAMGQSYLLFYLIFIVKTLLTLYRNQISVSTWGRNMLVVL